MLASFLYSFNENQKVFKSCLHTENSDVNEA